MLLNFSTNSEEHGNLLKQVFQSFEADSKTLFFSASTAEQIEVPTSVRLFSPLLRELIASQTFSTDHQTLIIVPDCSSTSIKHLINLLSSGCTQTTTDVDVETIIQDAKMLGIDLQNISYDDSTETGQVKVEIKEAEIQDEYYEDNVKKEMGEDGLKTLLVKSLKIASFAKADLAIQNVNQNKCLESKADFSSKSELMIDIKVFEQSNLGVSLSSPDIPHLGQLHCQECEKSFEKESELVLHKKKLHFDCLMCEYSVFTYRGMKKHMWRAHGGFFKHGYNMVQNQCLESKKDDPGKSEFINGQWV